jgi:hypothetical protein
MRHHHHHHHRHAVRANSQMDLIYVSFAEKGISDGMLEGQDFSN